MRFSTRVFLVTSTLSTVSAVAASVLILETTQRLYRQQYDTEYRQKLEFLAADFAHLEEAYDRVALNAAQVVARMDAGKRDHLSAKALTELATNLGVGGISIASSKDALARASPGQTPHRKVTTLPTFDGKRVVGVSMGFGDLARQLQRIVDDDSDVTRVLLLSHSGEVLGDVGKADPGALSIRVTTAAYAFEAQVSQESLKRMIRELRSRFFLILAGALMLALAASLWASRLLVHKIKGIRDSVDRIAQARDFSLTIPVSPTVSAHDEIDALAAHFNRFFSSMSIAQSELIEAKKAEARASIASQVAHDIRSPLTSMTLALNQLQEGLKKAGTQAASSEMISILSHGISRVTGIVKRLSKTAGKGISEATAVEEPRLTLVDHILFEVTQEHALKLPATQKFRVEGFERVPCIWAVIQVTELQAALSNLLNNAFEAVGAEGEVSLKASPIGRSYVIKIRDNGVGIQPENLARVFEREFTTGKSGGSGLGLFQAKKAIEWAGGTIALQSQPGQGTTVTVTLPAEPSPAWAADLIEMHPGQNLLVADDDPTILAAWREKAGAAGVPLREFETIAALDEALPSLGLGSDGSAKQLVFVLDQYAGGAQNSLTGTALIEKHGLGASAFLSTSEFDDRAIQDKLVRLKARMIPKPRLAAAKIVLLTAKGNS